MNPICVEDFADGLASLGKTSHLIQHLSNVAIDYQNGVFQGTNNLIEAIGKKCGNSFPVIDLIRRLSPPSAGLDLATAAGARPLKTAPARTSCMRLGPPLRARQFLPSRCTTLNTK